MRRPWRLIPAVVVLGAASFCPAAQAADIIIDDFNSAVNTVFILDTQVVLTVVGTTTVTDTGLADVLGGSRELTLNVLALDFPLLDQVQVGVVPVPGFVTYNSSTNADGNFVLRYDRSGAGLGVALAPARGIQVTVIDADPAAVPYGVEVRVTDSGSNTASLTRTVAISGGPLVIRFPFADFPGVNVSNVSEILVTFDPNNDGAADFRLDRIETYGSPPDVVPTASTLGLAVLMGLLVAVAGVRLGLARSGRVAA